MKRVEEGERKGKCRVLIRPSSPSSLTSLLLGPWCLSGMRIKHLSIHLFVCFLSCFINIYIQRPDGIHPFCIGWLAWTLASSPFRLAITD